MYVDLGLIVTVLNPGWELGHVACLDHSRIKCSSVCPLNKVSRSHKMCCRTSSLFNSLIKFNIISVQLHSGYRTFPGPVYKFGKLTGRVRSGFWVPSYNTITNLKNLQDRRKQLCTKFAQTLVKDDRFRDCLPPQTQSLGTRTRRTDQYKKSPIPFLVSLLNSL